MIQQLNQDSVRIFEIERPGSVAVGLNRLHQFYTLRLDLSGKSDDVFWMSDDKSDMMQILYKSGTLALGEFVDRKIIHSRCEVNIIRIRRPLDLHSEDRAVEIDRFPNIVDTQRDMAET